jgi:hypothetical protein
MPLQSGGGTWGTALYTVRGVGSESRDVDAWNTNGLYVEDRRLQVPMTLKHGPVTSSGKSAPGPDPRIRHRIQIVMFRPIRVDHTNCLQVAIKTHSFIQNTEEYLQIFLDRYSRYRYRGISDAGMQYALGTAHFQQLPMSRKVFPLKYFFFVRVFI